MGRFGVKHRIGFSGALISVLLFFKRFFVVVFFLKKTVK